MVLTRNTISDIRHNCIKYIIFLWRTMISHAIGTLKQYKKKNKSIESKQCTLNMNLPLIVSRKLRLAVNFFLMKLRNCKFQTKNYVYLLAYFGWAEQENIWPLVTMHGPCCSLSVHHNLEPNVFPFLPYWTQSISILIPLHEH